MTRGDDQVVWTTVFADGPGGGNPCPVVFGAQSWPVEQLQAAAADFGAETVFVLAPEQGGDVRLRYFVPRHEMEMCVHATIAATVVLARNGALPRNLASVETPLGRLDVAVDALGCTATVQQFAPRFGPNLTPDEQQRVLTALGVSTGELAPDVGGIRTVSTARAKVMVPLRDEAALDGLTPDFELLWTVCDELGVTGCYPFTMRAGGADAAARQFPARAGYVEDPATGVAAAALGAYLAAPADPPSADAVSAADGWQRWTVAQGRALGRPSLIIAEAFVDSGAVTATRVGGRMQYSEAPAVRL